MLSKNRIKYIHSLEQKKARRQTGSFVAEGNKCVGDLISAGYKPSIVVCTEEWAKENGITFDGKDIIRLEETEYNLATHDELRKASFLLHPQQVIGIFPMPDEAKVPSAEWINTNLCLALDGVQDPGNMGTIIRIADWFGINKIICSKETVDAYSPKVVQATMGSISRVSVIYTDLCKYISELPDHVQVYGTLLDGNDIYSDTLSDGGIIIMGNEGQGISKELRNHINHKLLIPPYPADSPTAESLNVAIATAITVAEFRRRSK